MTIEDKLSQLETRLQIATATEADAWTAYQEVQKPQNELIESKKAVWLESMHAKRDLECAINLLKEEIQCQPTQL